MNTLPLWRQCRVFASSLRFDMLELLDGSTSRCVKEVAEALGIAVDVTSKNLQLLASAGFMTRKHTG